MLSLLSLIIASGTVLRADTEQWEARNYPDPRANFTQCNVGEGSTLCDPDHMLTDAWRQTIQESITLQMERLREADIPYRAGAPEECRRNSTESPAIYIILAKRILTASNQSTTTNDLELFGEDLIRSFELNNQLCKNYILLLGVEGKTIKVWTGEDLEITREQVYSYLNKHMKLFTEKGYMEGLNKCVEELGDCVLDPYKDSITSTDGVQEAVVPDVEGTLQSPEMVKFVIPIWMYIITIFCLSITVGVLVLLGCHLRRTRLNRFIHNNVGNPKSDNESVRTNTIVFHPDNNENYESNKKNRNYNRHEEDYNDKDNSSIDSVTSQSLTSCSNANETEYQVNSLSNRRDSPAGIVYCSSKDNISQPTSDKCSEFKTQTSFDKKVPISSTMLSTDELRDGTPSEQDQNSGNFNFF